MIKWLGLFAMLAFLGVGFVLLINGNVASSTKDRIYNSVTDVPPKQAALLLGTAKYLGKNRINYYYKYRIEAAAKLWKAGKIKAIIVSGDNGTKYYDEATAMYKDLIRAGIPAKYITKDYAGFRTLDSIVRAKEVFGADDFIIISQNFHLERALYIADNKDIKAIGFRAKDFSNTKWAIRMKYREYLARTKAFLDLNILKTEPKFLGKKEHVTYRR